MKIKELKELLSHLDEELDFDKDFVVSEKIKELEVFKKRYYAISKFLDYWLNRSDDVIHRISYNDIDCSVSYMIDYLEQ